MHISRFRALLVAALALPLAVPAAAQEPVNIMHALGMAQAARAGGDTAGAIRAMEAADRMAPHHPLVLYALARVYAGAGDVERAIATLRRMEAIGMVADSAGEAALAPLAGHPEYASVRARLVAAGAPLVASDTAFVLPEPDLVPEAIAHDPRDGSFYVGSMGLRKVVRVRPGQAPADFVPPGPSVGDVLGVRVDTARNALWVNTFVRDSAGPATRGSGRGWAAVHRYRLRDGTLERRYVVADSASPHLFNDFALSRGGAVYVTDSEGGRVYRIVPGADSMEVMYGGAPDFVYPNGLALSGDERMLYVAHIHGISAFRLPDGAREDLPYPPAAPTGFIDGLYACGGSLVGIQNVPGFNRVMRFGLSPDGRRVVGGTVLERRHPAHEVPTTGVLVTGALHYIANSQLGRLRPDGSLAPAASPRGTVILRLPIPGCQ